MTALILWTVCLAIVGLALWCAPLGYQDERGWHPGEPDGEG